MMTSYFFKLSLVILLFLLVSSTLDTFDGVTLAAAAAESTKSIEGGRVLKPNDDADNVVRSSCVHASYPSICVRTLSSYPDPPKTPREVAQAAVKVSIAHARKLSEYLAEEQKESSKKREKSALKDCLEQMGDSVDELQRTLSELERLRGSGYNKFRMSNALTWVSAALSDDESCLDGLGETSKYKETVYNKVVGVAKVTSNALYFVNQLDHPKP